MASRALLTAPTPGSIRELVEQHYVRKEPKPPFTEDEWLRASGIAYTCPREYVYLHRSGIKRIDEVDANLLLCFLHGTSLHWGLQNRVLAELGLLHGRWRCKQCGFTVGGLSNESFEEVRALRGLRRGELIKQSDRFRELMREQVSTVVPRPEGCEQCGFSADDEWSSFEYEEMWFGIPDLRIGGHPDGFLKVPWRDDLGLLEVKSISDHGAFKVRNRPDIKHTAQLNIYLEATGVEWACVLYWAKGTFGTKALVEHHVDRDENLVARMRKALTSLWEGVEGGALPDRVCKNKSAPRARECPFVDPCFNIAGEVPY